MSRVVGAALLGIDGIAVEVEVRISSLLPRVDLVGLPEAAVRESVARVRAAVSSAGFSFPDRRITINLAPAALRKAGAGLDLPIALGVLSAAGALPAEALRGWAFAGELALDGRLRPVPGALALALAVREAGARRLIVPAPNADEAALARCLRVHAATRLEEVAQALLGERLLPRVAMRWPPKPRGERPPDLSDVRGQESAKRAVVVAAAGGHALLLHGPPGAGKTMLARRLPGLLPDLEFEEALEVTRIHGAAHPGPSAVACEPPFRAPHHGASLAGLLGGGRPPRPGEVSLAHRGILFLDELPEFERRAREGLRQVLEEGRVVLARAGATCVFPARFQLVAAANPCPCGWRLSGRRDCRCDPGAMARYAGRLAGPLLDRIDLHVAVPGVAWADLEAPAGPPETPLLRDRVRVAREIQARRLAAAGAPAHVRTNAWLPDRGLDEHVRATTEARRLLGRAVERLDLSARAVKRVLRVARSVADLAGEDRVDTSAMAEALSYRSPSTPS